MAPAVTGLRRSTLAVELRFSPDVLVVLVTEVACSHATFIVRRPAVDSSHRAFRLVLHSHHDFLSHLTAHGATQSRCAVRIVAPCRRTDPPPPLLPRKRMT